MLIEMNDHQARSIAQIAAQFSGVAINADAISIDRVGVTSGITLKNIGGCPINLRIRKVSERLWELPDEDPNPVECRWASKIPSYIELVSLVKGIKIIGDVKIHNAPAENTASTVQKSNVSQASVMEETGVRPSEVSKESLADSSEVAKAVPPASNKSEPPRKEFHSKKKKSRR